MTIHHDLLLESLLLQWASYCQEKFRTIASHRTVTEFTCFRNEILSYSYLVETKEHTISFHFEKKYIHTVLSAILKHGIPFEFSPQGNLLLYGITMNN